MSRITDADRGDPFLGFETQTIDEKERAVWDSRNGSLVLDGYSGPETLLISGHVRYAQNDPLSRRYSMSGPKPLERPYTICILCAMSYCPKI